MNQPVVQVKVRGEGERPTPGPMGIEFSINLNELRKRKIFLAVPMYGGNCHGIFVRSAIELSAQCAQLGIAVQLYFLFNESLITRARNYCADEFMRSDCTHLMFIDSDIGFDPKDVLFMLGLMGTEDDYHVVTGPYAKKTISWEKIVQAVNQGIGDPRAGKSPSDLERFVGDYVFNPKSGDGRIPIGAPAEVAEAGTGFMMIKRCVFEKLTEAYPYRAYKPDHVRNAHFDGSRTIQMFFQAEIDALDVAKFHDETIRMIRDGNHDSVEDFIQARSMEMNRLQETYSTRYLSEDYLFCHDVQRIGLKVWLCPWMRLQHAGSYIFGGSLADLAQIGAAATADPKQINPEAPVTPSGLPPVKKRKKK